jgi:pyruvate,water dikinase
MRLPFFNFKRKRSNSPRELESVRSLFLKFQRIQKLNTKMLELMAEMERALGGEYIFDRAFLESSVRDLSGLTYQVVYSLNAMSHNAYVDLYDRFQSIKGTLEDILHGGLGPFAASLALPFSSLGWEMEPLAGVLGVCLSAARDQLDILAPDGFVITVTGCRGFFEANGLGEKLKACGPSEVDRLFREAAIPTELYEAVDRELKALLSRRGDSIRLTVRACAAGGYGATQPEIAGLANVAPKDVHAACKSALAEYAAKAAAGEIVEGTLAVLTVHETIAAHVAGVAEVQARPGFPMGLFHIAAAPVGDPEKAEHFLLRRAYPFDLVESEVLPKAVDKPLYPGVKPLSRGPSCLYRGSALLGPRFLHAIAQCSVAFERALGYPQDLYWVRGDSDRPVIVDVRPAKLLVEESPEEAGADEGPSSFEILASGGETVQTGVSAGRVVHATDDNIENFPYGAVAVSHLAAPRFSPVLRRASALVTEVGTSVGHLATIARELRIPAIFGVKGALEKLPEGLEVTVDAGERKVLKGIAEPLLASQPHDAELHVGDPEYITLRRLLRWIMPLQLVNADASDFSSENCRTYHDIIHFAHERSVEELLHIQDAGRGLASLYARKLELDAPIELYILDLGGGARTAGDGAIPLEDVTSEPFLPFARGLTLKSAWSDGPVAISIKDIFSSIDRTFGTTPGQNEFAGRSHAIIAKNYMNVGLRLGYHFTVVDSYLGSNLNQNYIYFRFVGGFADERRRRRRVEFIRSILEEMHFKVTLTGDLAVAKLKIVEKEEMVEMLTRLGELTGFTRQLDVSMTSEEAIERFTKLFRERSASRGAHSDGKERSRGL